MSAMDWDTVEDAISAWIVDSSGLDATLVHYEYEPGAGSGSMIAVTIDDERKPGQDWKVYDSAPTFTFTADDTTSTFRAVKHGMQTGIGPIAVANMGGALPAGLDDATKYWAVRVDADHFQLALAKDANLLRLNGSRKVSLQGVVVPITTNGTGTHSVVAAPGAELRTRARGMRTAHVQLHAFGDLAFRMLSDVIAGVELHVEDLDIAGVGIGDTDPVQQTRSPRAGSTLERCAVAGVRIHLASELESRQTYVERVQLSLTEANVGPVRTFWTPTDPP